MKPLETWIKLRKCLGYNLLPIICVLVLFVGLASENSESLASWQSQSVAASLLADTSKSTWSCSDFDNSVGLAALQVG